MSVYGTDMDAAGSWMVTKSTNGGKTFEPVTSLGAYGNGKDARAIARSYNATGRYPERLPSAL